MDKFKVVFTGTLKSGVDQGEFVDTFSSRFKVSKEKALLMLSAGKPVTIKKGLDSEQAAKYIKVLDAMGMIVQQQPMDTGGLSLEPMEEEKQTAQGQPVESSPSSTSDKCPKCGSERIEDDNCLGCGIVISKYQAWTAENPDLAVPPSATNSEDPVATETVARGDQNPYQAPEAELTQETEQGEMTGPMSVPAGNSWSWLRDGYGHFRQNPGAWMLAAIILLVFNIVLSLVPLIGTLIVLLLAPVLAAGFMIGCQEQEQGGNFSVGHLFHGFRQNTGQLFLVGIVYLAGFFVIGVIVSMMMGGSMLLGGGLEAMSSNDPAAMAEMFNPSVFLLPLLVGMLLFIPLIMAYWFAPALVALEGVTALNAMKLSFIGCLKNILPFLLYGIIVIGFLILFGIVMTIVTVIGTLLSGGSPIIAVILYGIMVLVGMLVPMPVITASIYTSYRDIYFS